MKKHKNGQIAPPEISATDVPFFARQLGPRQVQVDDLGQVTGGNSGESRVKHRERLRKS